MNSESRMWIVISVGLVLAIMFAMNASANDRVKHCINLVTQEIITVQKGQSCPYPTVEL